MGKKKAEQPTEKYCSSAPQIRQQAAAVVAPVSTAMKQVPKAVATSVNRIICWMFSFNGTRSQAKSGGFSWA